MNIKLVSIDLAKDVFQVYAINQEGKPIMNKRVKRNNLVSTVIKLKPQKVVMESCYTANYWGRVFQSLDIEVGLIPAQFVKPFVRGNKNDANDAPAIAEAAQRPNIRYVPIKTIAQQDLQSLHRIRQRHVSSCTALINQIRGLVSEYGIVIPRSKQALKKALPGILEDASNGLSDISRRLVSTLLLELNQLIELIEKDEQHIKKLMKEDEDFLRLMGIPGFGYLVSSALLSAVGNGAHFANGRALSSWLGLTPQQYASGNKSNMGGITKRGNCYLRSLLIHGARSRVNALQKERSPLNCLGRKNRSKARQTKSLGCTGK